MLHFIHSFTKVVGRYTTSTYCKLVQAIKPKNFCLFSNCCIGKPISLSGTSYKV